MLINKYSRFKGGILGLAVGDALGVPVEFYARERLQQDPVTDMRGHGEHNQEPGTWSDDTSMALCLLEGLADGSSWDGIGHLFERWLLRDHWTPRGRVFDSGRTTREAILSYANFDDLRRAGLRDEASNGNGSLMRTLPVALMCCSAGPEELATAAHEASRLTHAHPRSQMACGIYCDLVSRLLGGGDDWRCWDETRAWASTYYATLFPSEISTYAEILARTADDYAALPSSHVRSGGYVVETLDAALWCLFGTDSFAKCCLSAVNLGKDSDTTGAVAGGLAGVYYGCESIPESWLNVIARRDDICQLVDRAWNHLGTRDRLWNEADQT